MNECKRTVKVLVADASSLSLKFSSRFFVLLLLLLLLLVHHQHVLDTHSQVTHRSASFPFCLSTTACSLPILRHRRSQQLRETNTHTRVSASQFPAIIFISHSDVLPYASHHITKISAGSTSCSRNQMEDL